MHHRITPIILLLLILQWSQPCSLTALELGGETIPKEKLILFLFFGHSNLDGMALKQDNTVQPRCWAYVKGRWIPATDKDLPFESRQKLRSSCVYHFLKRMAADYPDYHFAAIKMTGQAWQFNSGGYQMMRGGIGYTRLIRAYNEIRNDVILGGLVTMIGMNDASRAPNERKQDFKRELLLWLGHIREDLKAPDLPIIFGRLEAGQNWEYKKNFPLLLETIESLPELDPKKRLVLAPREMMPAAMFVDLTHYSWQGNLLFANDAIDLYQEKGWDSWCRAGGRNKTVRKPGLSAGTAAKTAGDDWPGDRQGLLFIWERGNVNNTIISPGDGTPRLCLPVMRGFARYTRHYAMRPSGGSFELGPKIGQLIMNGCKTSNQISLECTITPHGETRSPGPQPIICAGVNIPSQQLNFVLEQQGKDLLLSMRTSIKTPRIQSIKLGELEPGKSQHIIVNYSPGKLTYYRNGINVKHSNKIKGDLSLWTPVHLTFGQDHTGNGSWRGTLEGITIYNRIIGAQEVTKRFRAYSKKLRNRRDAARTELLAKLVETVALPAKDDPEFPIVPDYPRLIVHYAYEIREVLSGNCPDKRILVAHWAVMDQKNVPALISKRIGSIYRLTLEPMQDHPEAEDERQIMLPNEDFDAPLYYDVDIHDTDN